MISRGTLFTALCLPAYILQVDGFPSGVAPLDAEPDSLARITFEQSAPDNR